jgi:hemerythrin-like metal-binding protein
MAQAGFMPARRITVQFLEWSAERNAIAVPELDEQHQELFVMGNDLYQALAGGALVSAVEPGLRELIAHTVAHFAREERIMRSKRYPAYAWHKGQHDTVRTKLAGLEQCLQNGDPEAVLPILDYVTAWLQTHTAVSDRMMGAFLRTQDLSRTRYPHVPATVRSRK